ncbi:hypothetical protein VPH35_003036 [Triticum aestivum]|uniref:uncharacterized protein n=1 Tax=Triticum aestivum TaxID=4565 RepID=UPI001D02CFA7|nr:uncharacterized protein LOC123054563 [Triticum aestivum]
MTTTMRRTSQIDDAMEDMRAGRGRGGRAAGHEGHGGCGRKQHGLKERRMWAGSEVGGDSSAGRQRAPVSAMHEFPEASSPTRFSICCISVLLVKIWGVAAGEGRRPMTGRSSRPSRSASRRGSFWTGFRQGNRDPCEIEHPGSASTKAGRRIAPVSTEHGAASWIGSKRGDHGCGLGSSAHMK